MSRKTVLFAALVTLAYWLGNLTGCASQKQPENNYKVLDEDKPLLQTSPQPNKPGDSMANPPPGGLVVADASQPDATEPAATQQGGVAPSLIGLDRSGWSPMTVGPADDVISHWPVYFHDFQFGVHPQDPDANPVQNTLAVSDRAGNYDGANSLCLFAQPVKFMWDLLVLPVSMAIEPPFVHEYTPPR